MFNYVLLLVALVAVTGVPSLESLAAGGALMDYVVAVGVALMMKPWLEGHLE